MIGAGAEEGSTGSAGGAKKGGFGGWGSVLFESLDGRSHSASGARRRPSSPAVASRSPRPTMRGRGSVRTPEPPPRTPTPPLTLDDINSTYNPFPLFHIRVHLIPEVALLVLPLLYGLWRLYTMHNATASSQPLPYFAFLALALSIPFIALFRRDTSYFKAPFTDERGYRDPKAADDGIAVALALPLLLAMACYWDIHAGAVAAAAGTESSTGFGLEGIAPLVAVWESRGVHALPSLDYTTLLAPAASAVALLTSRHQLVLLTALNTAILLLHLLLARTVLKIERLPKGNTKRFFGFMGVAVAISSTVWAALSAWDYLREGGSPGIPPQHPMLAR